MGLVLYKIFAGVMDRNQFKKQQYILRRLWPKPM